jgi:hypothetical protein
MDISSMHQFTIPRQPEAFAPRNHGRKWTEPAVGVTLNWSIDISMALLRWQCSIASVDVEDGTVL